MGRTRLQGLTVLLSLAQSVGGAPAFADCLSLMSKGRDQVAHMLLSNPDVVLLFLGTVEHEKFVGDFSRRYDIDANNSIDITYRVEDVFRGSAPSTITLRTPFFCEACTYDSEAELAEGLNSDVGRRVIVYEWEEVDQEDHRTLRVSGGCPDSIDARRSKDTEDGLVLALRSATHKN